MSTLTGQEPKGARRRCLRYASPLCETLESFLFPLPIRQIGVHEALEDLPVVKYCIANNKERLFVLFREFPK